MRDQKSARGGKIIDFIVNNLYFLTILCFQGTEKMAKNNNFHLWSNLIIVHSVARHERQWFKPQGN